MLGVDTLPREVDLEALMSEEGVNQGDPLSMVLCILILYVLAEQILGKYTGFLWSWYADEFSTAVAVAHLNLSISHIETMGPVCGFFIKPDKSQLVKAPGVSEEPESMATSPL